MHSKSPGRWSTTNRRRREKKRARKDWREKNESERMGVCVCVIETPFGSRCIKWFDSQREVPFPSSVEVFSLFQFRTIMLTHTVWPISQQWDSCEAADGETHRVKATKRRTRKKRKVRQSERDTAVVFHSRVDESKLILEVIAGHTLASSSPFLSPFGFSPLPLHLHLISVSSNDFLLSFCAPSRLNDVVMMHHTEIQTPTNPHLLIVFLFRPWEAWISTSCFNMKFWN